MCNLKKDVVKAEKLYLLRKYFNSVKLTLFHFLKFNLHKLFINFTEIQLF